MKQEVGEEKRRRSRLRRAELLVVLRRRLRHHERHRVVVPAVGIGRTLVALAALLGLLVLAVLELRLRRAPLPAAVAVVVSWCRGYW